jgi:hypothetical protein
MSAAIEPTTAMVTIPEVASISGTTFAAYALAVDAKSSPRQIQILMVKPPFAVLFAPSSLSDERSNGTNNPSAAIPENAVGARLFAPTALP